MFNTATNGILPMIDLNGNNNNGMWGDGGWWVVLILFALFGWGGNGFGGGFGGGNMFYPWMMNNDSNHTDSTIQRGVDTITTNNKLDSIDNSITSGFFGQNTAILQGFGNLNTSLCGSFDSVNANINNLGYQLQNSLLQVSNAMDNIRYENAQNTAQIVQAGNANTQRIVDQMTENTIQELRDRLQASQFANSQSQQTNDIISQLSPTPKPAYITMSPYQSQMYGCNCGCGCNMA